MSIDVEQLRPLLLGRDSTASWRWLRVAGGLVVALTLFTASVVFVAPLRAVVPTGGWLAVFAAAAVSTVVAAAYSACRNDGWAVCVALVATPAVAFVVSVDGIGALVGGTMSDLPAVVRYSVLAGYTVLAGTVAFVAGAGWRRLGG